jgi:hypothetical protein
MTWTSLRHLNLSCQESGQGLDEQKSQRYWESTTGLKQARAGPSARRMKDLLKLNGDQLRWVVEFFTRHCHLKEHLFKLGLTDNPILRNVRRRRWISHTHSMWLWCHSYLRFRHLGQFSMEPNDYNDSSINKVLQFIPGVELIKG